MNKSKIVSMYLFEESLHKFSSEVNKLTDDGFVVKSCNIEETSKGYFLCQSVFEKEITLISCKNDNCPSSDEDIKNIKETLSSKGIKNFIVLNHTIKKQ